MNTINNYNIKEKINYFNLTIASVEKSQTQCWHILVSIVTFGIFAIIRAVQLAILKGMVGNLKSRVTIDLPLRDNQESFQDRELTTTEVVKQKNMPFFTQQIDKVVLPKRQEAGSLLNCEQVLKSLLESKGFINSKINFITIDEDGKELIYENVYVSHLLCSGKLMLPPEKVISYIQKSGPICFSSIDESNLWGNVACFLGEKGSGNNVLKSAVAGASASISGKVENKKIVEFLLNILKNTHTLQERKDILDAKDNYAFGGHTIPEFLVRQGYEDLAIEVLNMGATITEDLLCNSLASAGSTKFGLHLAFKTLNYFIDNATTLSKEIYWKAKIGLIAVGSCDAEDLLNNVCNKGSKEVQVTKSHLNYWKSLSFHECINNFFTDQEAESYMPFGEFSGQFREDENISIFQFRTAQINNSEESKNQYKNLLTLFLELNSPL